MTLTREQVAKIRKLQSTATGGVWEDWREYEAAVWEALPALLDSYEVHQALRDAVARMHEADEAYGCGFYGDEAWCGAYEETRALAGEVGNER